MFLITKHVSKLCNDVFFCIVSTYIFFWNTNTMSVKTVFITLSTTKHQLRLVKLLLSYWLCILFRGKHNAAVGNSVFFSSKWLLKSIQNVELLQKCDNVKVVGHIMHTIDQKVIQLRNLAHILIWGYYLHKYP